MKKIIVLFLLFQAILASHALADRGSIPFKSTAVIYEPEQRAMIAWNGEEQILVLSTDLAASEPTQVLEVMPFPAEPKVKKGDVEIFKKAAGLIERKLNIARAESLRGTKSAHVAQSATPGGKVTFHDIIGSRDVSVTQVLNKEGFVAWVEKYLRSKQVTDPHIPENIKNVINDYIKDGFEWFVFNVVSLDTEPKTNQAVQYRFKTDFLYYPLRIMQTEKGATHIGLIILTPRLLSRFTGLSINKVHLRHQPVTITSKELSALNKDMALLLEQKELKLRIWDIREDISSLTKDLIVK